MSIFNPITSTSGDYVTKPYLTAKHYINESALETAIAELETQLETIVTDQNIVDAAQDDAIADLEALVGSTTTALVNVWDRETTYDDRQIIICP